MFQLLARFLVSFLVTNWIYSEIVLLVPPFEDFAVAVYRTLQIPTHDKWPEVAKSGSAKALEREIYGSLKGVDSWTNPFVSLFDRGVRTVWQQNRLVPVSSSNDSPFESAFKKDKSKLPFMSGSGIFVRTGVYF